MTRYPRLAATWAIAALALAGVLGLDAVPAAADSRFFLTTGVPGVRGSAYPFHPPHASRKIIVTDPGTTIIVKEPGTRIIVAPRPVYYVPTYMAPSWGRWVPGYWSYAWVPQVYTSYVWAPGSIDAYGNWVEGHYEPRVIQTGYYQPLWVEGYWAR